MEIAMTKTQTIPQTKIRWMIARDLPAVMDIERGSFGDPWTEGEILAVLRERNCVAMVSCDSDELPLGYMVYELHKTGINLLNIAVHPRFRLGGIAGRMIAKLVSKLSPGRRESITATVRESNLPAQKFLRSCLFKATSVLRNFYAGYEEDGYVFKLRLVDLMPPAGRDD